MRTTLDLDPDVAEQLRRFMRNAGVSMEQAVNTLIRTGFAEREERRADEPFQVRAWRAGVRPGIDADKLGQYADELEDQEIARKLLSEDR